MAFKGSGGGGPPTASASTFPDADASPAAIVGEPIGVDEVKGRALAGAAVDTVRGLTIRSLSFATTAVLARLLTPRDFGLVAFGIAVTTFATFLANGGIATALIRRREPPEPDLMSSLLGFQLVATVVLAVVVTAAMAPFGKLGAVTGLLVFSLPLETLRSPSYVIFERRLDYRPIAICEILEVVAYGAWAIATVAAGWGVWGLASAFLVRAAVGSAAAWVLEPLGRLRPTLSWSRVRRLLGFGFRYQSVGLAQMARDQGVNIATAAIAGVPALGLWSVANRLLQIVVLLFQSLWRVSFPGMSRLVQAEEDVSPLVGRAIAATAVVTGALLAPLAAASTPLVTTLLGHRWSATAPVVSISCLALMIGGPISVALAGFLWAKGDARAPLIATAVGIVVWGGVMLPLLPSLGVRAVAIGWVFSSISEAAVLVHASRRYVKVNVVPALLAPTTVAVLGAMLGWGITRSSLPAAIALFAATAAAEGFYLLGLFAVDRTRLLTTLTLVSRGLRAALARAEPSRAQATPAVSATETTV
jgi:O-antigen/teichoic acid export membrane protein